MQPGPGCKQRLRWPVARRGVSWRVGLGRCRATRPRVQAETTVACGVAWSELEGRSRTLSCNQAQGPGRDNGGPWRGVSWGVGLGRCRAWQVVPGCRHKLRWPVKWSELGGRSGTLLCMASRPREQADCGGPCVAWSGLEGRCRTLSCNQTQGADRDYGGPCGAWSWGVGLGRCRASRPREQAETTVARGVE